MKIPAHTLKHQLALHSWVGISSAILLTISFISGSLTVFSEDISRWASPPAAEIRPAADMAALARLMQHMAEHPEHTSSFLLYLHTDENAPAPLHWETGDSETWAYLDADGTLHSHTRPATAAGHILDELHRTAGIPTIAGEYSMGIVAILYLLALISSTLLALPKLGQQCLALRLNHSRRRAWLDIHNLLGLTALPFHLIIAVTTVLFVFAAPLSTLLQPLAPPPPVARETLAWTSYYLPFLAAIAYAHPKGAASRIPLMRGAGALLCAIPASTLLAAVGLLPFTPRLLPLVDATALAFGIALLAAARRTASATNIHTP